MKQINTVTPPSLSQFIFGQIYNTTQMNTNTLNNPMILQWRPLIQRLTTSTTTNRSNLVKRISHHYNCSFELIPYDKIILFVEGLQVKASTKAEYLKELQAVGSQTQQPWALRERPLTLSLLKKYREGALPPKSATPIMAEDLSTITTAIRKNILNLPEVCPVTKLAMEMAMLGAERTDEIFRITPSMINAFNLSNLPSLYAITIRLWTSTKSSKLNPAAIRFLDVMFLNQNQFNILRQLIKANAKNDTPIFPASIRKKIFTLLRQTPFTEHSWKKGASEYLAELAAMDKIPASVIPTFLKHEQQGQLSSTTMRYMSTPIARFHVLMAEKLVCAAIHMRNKIFGESSITSQLGTVNLLQW